MKRITRENFFVWSIFILVSCCSACTVAETDTTPESELISETVVNSPSTKIVIQDTATLTTSDQLTRKDIPTIFVTSTRMISPSIQHKTDNQIAYPISTPTPTIAISPVVLTHTNTIRLYDAKVHPSESCIDLDTGQVTEPQDPKADIKFFEDGGSMTFFYIVTINGSKAENFPYRTMRYSQCFNHVDDYSEYARIPDFFLGSICVLTNEERLSVLKYEATGLNEYGDWVEFELVTWSEILDPK